MATSRLNLTRDQLATFLKDHEQIKQFERLFATVDAIAPDFVNEVAISAGTAQATANDALALIEALENTLTADGAVINAKATLALQELKKLKDQIELAVLHPAMPQLGTLSAYNEDNVRLIGFDTSPFPAVPNPAPTGTLYWDGNSTLGLQMSQGVLAKIAQSQFTYVKASSAITKGQLCKHTGAVGGSGVITAAPTSIGMTDPNQIVGVAAEDIPLNGFGFIQDSGDLRGFDTTGSTVGEVWADGDSLYYNPAFIGGLTKTKPSAPNLKSYVGEVINAGSGGSGSIHVRMFPGSVLGGTDSNVQFGTIADKDLIQYDSVAQYWKNVAPSSISIGTATNLAGGAAGSVPYQTGAGATTFLPIGTATQVLKVNAGATAPEWVSGAALSKVDDTNVTLTLGGSPTTSLLAATSLTLGWTGTLAVSRGGTGTGTSFTPGSVVFAGASGVYSQDNANLFWDDSNNCLGIGTATPGSTLDVNGTLTFSGLGRRIIADLSDATVANRLAFQTSVLNGNSQLYVIPNGTATQAQYIATNSSDMSGTSLGTNVAIVATSTDSRLASGRTSASATFVPLTFYTSGTERVRIDTAGNVGIGSASPAAKLDVTGAAAFSTSATTPIIIGGTGTTSTLRLRSTSGVGTTGADIIFQTGNNGGTEVMRCLNNGNVGIGASTLIANTRLQVTQNADANYSTTFLVNTTKTQLVLRDLSDTGTYTTPFSILTFVAGSTGAGTSYIAGAREGVATSFLAFGTGSSSNASERMRIDSVGNIGIGVTPVAYGASNRVLHINGGANSTEIRLTNNTTGTAAANGGLIQQAGNDLYIWNVENSFLSFGTNNTEQMRVTSAGNVAVGTTSTNGFWGSTNSNAHVQAAYSSIGTIIDTASKGLVLTNTDTTTDNYSSLVFGTRNSNGTGIAQGAIYSINGTRTGSFNAGQLGFAYSNASGVLTEAMRINASGNVGIGTSTNLSTLTVNGSFASRSPSTVNAATYTVAATDGSLRFTTTNCTVTLPAAASFPGRILYLNTITANSVTSASSNVIPLGSNTAGTAILAATAGKFAMIQSDGTNWITMMAN